MIGPSQGLIHRRGAAVAALGLAAAVVAALAVAGSATAAPATGQIRVATGAEAVAGSYIVGFKSGAATGSAGAVGQAAGTLAGRYGGAVRYTYTSAVRGFAANMSAAAARRLAADPQVAWVEQDSKVRLITTQSGATWGLDRIDQRALPLTGTYSYDTTAANVHAYIIDTGIRTTHVDFGGRASVGTDTVGDGRNGQDCNGHGTHVSGTVGGATFGVAKGVSLVAVRVLDCAGSGTNAGVIAGVDWVTAHRISPAVANMSLGGGVSAALDQAVRNSIAAGVSYAIAAGNSNANACNSSPARTAEAITVGATDFNDNRASFSNFGACLDIFAPGVNITSDWGSSDTATNTISGTSMATPHTAGAAALFLAANATASPATVRNALVAAGSAGRVVNPGTGSPNVLLFTNPAGGPPPPPPGPFFENAADVGIPDAGAAVESPITVTGVAGNAPATLQVGVDIKHTYRGDLVISLVAPDGTTIPLKSSNASDGADNVIMTFPVNAAAEVANGTWRLRVQDVFAVDTGFIDRWSLQF
jgi:subtilisin family serine protease